MARDEVSPVVRLFEVWSEGIRTRAMSGGRGGAIRVSQEAYSAGFYGLLDVAIRGNLRWKPGDAAEIERRFQMRAKYVCRIDLGLHARAVQAENESAIRSIEAHLGIRPWIWPVGTPIRLCLGASFHVRSIPDRRGWWFVTTLQEERIILCQYDDKDHHRSKPTRRWTLTREALAALAPPTAKDWPTVAEEAGLPGPPEAS